MYQHCGIFIDSLVVKINGSVILMLFCFALRVSATVCGGRVGHAIVTGPQQLPWGYSELLSDGDISENQGLLPDRLCVTQNLLA